MTEYRVARPEEQAALTFFGSMVFSMDGEKTDFETLIPKEYAKERSCAEHHLLAVNEQGIRGMIATLPGVMRVGKLELKTGYVGTVSVHPQARGEGHEKADGAVPDPDAGKRDGYFHAGRSAAAVRLFRL